MTMIIEAKVKTRAKRRNVQKDDSGIYHIHTNCPPEKGKANEDVVDMIAEHFNVAKSRVHIKSGHTSARKIIEILP